MDPLMGFGGAAEAVMFRIAIFVFPAIVVLFFCFVFFFGPLCFFFLPVWDVGPHRVPVQRSHPEKLLSAPPAAP